MESSLVDINHVCQWFVHEDPDDSLGELLLLVQEFHFPFGLRAIYDLRLSVGGSMLYVDLTDERRREFW